MHHPFPLCRATRLLLIVFMLHICCPVFAQDTKSVITVGLDKNDHFFTDAVQIANGQTITLQGTGDTTLYKSVTIDVVSSEGSKQVLATIGATGWKADIGPFQPRQLVNISIKAIRSATAQKKKIDTFQAEFAASLKSTLTSMTTELNN